jgi:hypothetical protein
MYDTICLNLDQAHLVMTLVTKFEPNMLTGEQLFDTLDALPGHTEFDIQAQSWMNHDLRTDRVRLMARDIPRRGRRYTCLSSGMEWFDIREIAKNAEWVAIIIHLPGSDDIVASAMLD